MNLNHQKISFHQKASFLAALTGLLAPMASVMGQVPANWPASYPEWWYDADPAQSMIDVSRLDDPDNQSPILQGQLLYMATVGIQELDEQLAPIGGAGFDINVFKDPNEDPSYYSPAAIGQLKFVASKFYNRFAEVGYQPGSTGWNPSIVLDEGAGDNSPQYPWKDDQTPENLSIALIGQAKFLFSWDIEAWSSVDSDNDSLPDWWENAFLGDLSHTASGDADGDGMNNLLECQESCDPLNRDTDGDEMEDMFEYYYSLDPVSSEDQSLGPDGNIDGDSLTNLEEFRLGSLPRSSNESLQVVVDDGIRVKWFGVRGRVYFVQYTTSLGQPWNTSDVYLIGDNTEVQFLVDDVLPQPSPIAFFRLLVEAEPFLEDFDGDRVPNQIELANGWDPLDASSSDGDSLPDDWENYWLGALSLLVDSTDYDLDGIDAQTEFAVGLSPIDNLNADYDGDGISNGGEYAYGTDPEIENTNTDGDLLSDRAEIALGLDPDDSTDAVDSDGDGVVDAIEKIYGLSTSGTTDLDGDSMHDEWELLYHLNVSVNDGVNDPDGDGLTNLEEFQEGTNPWAFDTDGDGIPDGLELTNSLDPLAADRIQVRNNYVLQLSSDLEDSENQFMDRVSMNEGLDVGDEPVIAAINSSGVVYAQGDNARGQLGLGSSAVGTVYDTPVLTGFSGAKSLAVGRGTLHVVKADGTVLASGAQDGGRLGNGQTGTLEIATPITLGGLSHVSSINAKNDVYYEAVVAGEVYAWGTYELDFSSNYFGDGLSTPEPTPFGPLKGIENAVRIGSDYTNARTGQTAAVLNDGSVLMWGRNISGGLTHSGDNFYVTPENSYQSVAGIPAMEFVSSNYGAVAGFDQNGGLWTWGGFNGRIHSTQSAQRTPLNRQTPSLVRAIGTASTGASPNDGNAYGFWLGDDAQVRRFYLDLDSGTISNGAGSGSTFRSRELGLPFRVIALSATKNGVFLLSESGTLHLYTEIDGLIELKQIAIPSFFTTTDSNGDGLSDALARFLGLNPNSTDTNGDGLSDHAAVQLGLEARDWDFDGDGIPNAIEIQKGLDPYSEDSDGDGMLDNEELYLHERLANYILTTEPNTSGPEIELFSPAATAL